MWWRKNLPCQPTRALLFIFFGSFIVSLFIYCFFTKTFTILEFQKIIQFLLFYGSSALVYIILYSAIEQQSPTLAIIYYIVQSGKKGCDAELLKQHLNASNEIKIRLTLIEKSGWIFLSNKGWQLTEKGYQMAHLFKYAAIIFGLNKGG